MVLSDAPTPKTVDVGTAAFHEIWITGETPVEIAASVPEPTDRPLRTPPPAGGVMVRFTEMAPVRMMFVLIDGAITDEPRAAAGPLEFFDQVLG